MRGSRPCPPRRNQMAHIGVIRLARSRLIRPETAEEGAERRQQKAAKIALRWEQRDADRARERAELHEAQLQRTRQRYCHAAPRCPECCMLSDVQVVTSGKAYYACSKPPIVIRAPRVSRIVGS